MTFTQIIEVQGAEDQELHDLVSGWDSDQSGVAPGYQGARVLADGSNGRHVIEVDFSSKEEAQRNNDRPETQQWAEQLRKLGDGEPSYRDLREVCTTYGSR